MIKKKLCKINAGRSLLNHTSAGESVSSWKRFINHLLTESEVITGKSQTSALMYWPSDVRKDEFNKLFIIWPFSAILKKNTMKTPDWVIFHIHLRALWLSSSRLILKKYLYASFSFSFWKYSCTLSSFFVVVFAHALVAFTHNSKEPSSRKRFS